VAAGQAARTPASVIEPLSALGAAIASASRVAATLSRMSASDASGAIGIEPERLAAWREQDDAVQVIDVREPYEREAGHIEGTRHIELVQLSGAADTVDRERPVVFYCRVGARSEMAAQAFRAAGFEAYSLSGGLLRWAHEQRPLAPEGGVVADH
jgi:rhodanese-related sulfurtransferase